ncbi:MAG: alpha-ketoacid dehydrogenase subunit beta [Acidimicrobiales bacterium]
MSDAGSRDLSIAAALNAALDVALSLDPKVILLGEDIADPAGGVFKVTKGLSTTHGTDRVRATPIAEQSIAGAAVGLALGGYRPVAEIMFFDFLTIAMDQVVNHAAKLRYMSGGTTPMPVTVRTLVGSGRFGPQHAQQLEAWFMHTPGIKVVMPSTPADAKGLLLSCIFDEDPCLFIEHSMLLFGQKSAVPDGDYRVPLGSAAIRRPGTSATVITYGAQVQNALVGASALAQDGIDVEVIDLRSLVPLDTTTVLSSVARTRRAVVVHDASTFCGPGAELAALITEELWGDLAGPVERVGASNAPVAFAPELDVHPTVDDICAAVRKVVER